MPCVICRTNIAVSAAAKATVKARLGEAIGLIPGKTEEWLMVCVEDQCALYFRGDGDSPAAFVEVKLLIRKDVSDAYESLTREITTLLEETLGIPAGRIYVCFQETRHWGFAGKLL